MAIIFFLPGPYETIHMLLIRRRQHICADVVLRGFYTESPLLISVSSLSQLHETWITVRRAARLVLARKSQVSQTGPGVLVLIAQIVSLL